MFWSFFFFGFSLHVQIIYKVFDTFFIFIYNLFFIPTKWDLDSILIKIQNFKLSHILSPTGHCFHRGSQQVNRVCNSMSVLNAGVFPSAVGIERWYFRLQEKRKLVILSLKCQCMQHCIKRLHTKSDQTNINWLTYEVMRDARHK